MCQVEVVGKSCGLVQAGMCQVEVVGKSCGLVQLACVRLKLLTCSQMAGAHYMEPSRMWQY